MKIISNGKRRSATPRWRGFLKVLYILLLISALAPEHRALAGRKAPDFALLDLSGQKVTLSEHQGRVVILDFWATWCMPCRVSITELVELQEKYHAKGLRVLGVNMDGGQKGGYENLISFKRKYKINYPILHPDERVVPNYFQGTTPRLPTAFLIDREGNLMEMVVGYRSGVMEILLKRLLN